MKRPCPSGFGNRLTPTYRYVKQSQGRLFAVALIAIALFAVKAFFAIIGAAILAGRMLAGAAFLFIDLTDDAVIMFRMLEIILSRNPIARRMGVAGQRLVFLINLESIATDTHIRAAAVIVLVPQRAILATATIVATPVIATTTATIIAATIAAAATTAP